MVALPPPMKMLPSTARITPILLRLTTNRAMADARIAANRDNKTVGQSYCTGIGKRNASIPM